MDLDATYVRTAPDPQFAVDIFQDEWSSRLPALPGSSLAPRSGTTPLFEDPRIDWASDRLSELGIAIEGKRILELGPLEGGHTAMLCARGAAEVVAIEANKRSYLKCLIVKELYGLDRARFLLGESVDYLRTTNDVYDIAIVSGLLYHLANPVELIALLARRCRAIFLWTVVYDPAFFARFPEKLKPFHPPQAAHFDGFPHTVHRMDYGEALDWKGFCGGSRPFCHWLTQEDILRALAHFGLPRQVVITAENVHATALQLVAVRGQT